MLLLVLFLVNFVFHLFIMSSPGSAVRGLVFHPQNLGLSPSLTHMIYLWDQEGHLVKIAVVHWKSSTLCSQYQYQSQIYLACTSFIIKNTIGGATWEWGANCPCNGGSSMSSSETWNTEVCCTVIARVVIHSRFVVQPQKSAGDCSHLDFVGDKIGHTCPPD